MVKAAFQMDPIEGLHIEGDSTFALLLEGQRRGHQLFCYSPDDLSLREGDVFARGSFVQVQDVVGDHFDKDDVSRVALKGFDTVFLRQDPPFDMSYITSTHILEQLHPKPLVVNNPRSVRNAPEKLFVLDFPELTPPTMIARSLDDVKAFRADHGDIIVKPLYGNGGAGVFRLPESDTNLGSLVELFQTISREPFVVQKYLPDVSKGDKRIILVDGEIAGAINRIPPVGETRSNMHIGGRPAQTEITPRDREICDALGPELKKRGLIFTGIDVIGDWLTEINVTSPTGIREIQRFDGTDIASMIWDVVERDV